MNHAQAVTQSYVPPQRRTLSEIVSEMLEVLDNAGGEVTAAVDELSAELEEKAAAYAVVVRQMEAEQKAFEDLANGYKAKAQAREQTITGLKFRMEHALKASGMDKLKTPTCTWYFQSSKRVDIPNEESFVQSAEDRFVTVKTYPDKGAIKKALEAGEVIEGAQLAESKHVRFR